MYECYNEATIDYQQLIIFGRDSLEMYSVHLNCHNWPVWVPRKPASFKCHIKMVDFPFLYRPILTNLSLHVDYYYYDLCWQQFCLLQKDVKLVSTVIIIKSKKSTSFLLIWALFYKMNHKAPKITQIGCVFVCLFVCYLHYFYIRPIKQFIF